MERGSLQPSLLSSGRLLSAHTFPNLYSKNLSGELSRESFSPLPPNVGEYTKLRFQALKSHIQEQGLEGHRKEDDLLLGLSLSKVGGRVPGGEVEYRINLKRLRELWSWDLTLLTHGPRFWVVISKSDLRQSLFQCRNENILDFFIRRKSNF